MNLDVCLQNIEKVGEKFAVANQPSDVMSCIHVYVHLFLFQIDGFYLQLRVSVKCSQYRDTGVTNRSLSMTNLLVSMAHPVYFYVKTNLAILSQNKRKCGYEVWVWAYC